jgi:hypothetical protein
MISPNQPIASLSTPITLGELQRKCDVMEGYMDLGLLDEAVQVMRELKSELRLTIEDGELFMDVLMKTNLPALPALDETGRTPASLSYL